MRKICLCLVVLSLFLVGCGENTSSTENKTYVNNQKSVAQVLEEQAALASVEENIDATSVMNTQNIDTNSVNVSVDESINAPINESINAPIDVQNNDLLGVDIVGSDIEKTYDNIDIDLSVMSSNLIYSEVLNIMTAPYDYCGKVIKMSGLFTAMLDQVDNRTYLACIIQDATACCAQGIEFQPYLPDLNGEDVRNLEGTEIEVVGTFDTYEIGDYTYFTLKDARILN